MPVNAALEFTELNKSILAALQAWQDLEGTPGNLLSHLLLVQEQQAAVPGNSPTGLRLATNQVLLEGLTELTDQDRQGASILKARFLDHEKTRRVAYKQNIGEYQVRRRQAEAIRRLTRIIFDKEMALREARAHALQAQLNPPTYTALFGVDDTTQILVEKLLSTTAPWLAVITGMGGIGKTSLADAVARRISSYFYYEQIIWLRLNPFFTSSGGQLLNGLFDTVMAQLAQHLCPHMSPETRTEQRNLQVRRVLKAAPYLVVINNLEAETDTVSLLTHLNDVANPSKFLLTTRTRPPGEIGILTLPLLELSIESAADLIRHHAQSIGLTDLIQVSQIETQPIYNLIGGNPLAIKLIVGLAAVMPLAQILEDLIQVQSQEIENLYRHIYWQAWHSLSKKAQVLLEMMPVAAQVGITPEQILAISGLKKEELWPAVAELVNRSLLEARGTTWERRYGIHRLTESFLRTEIIHWPEDSL